MFGSEKDFSFQIILKISGLKMAIFENFEQLWIIVGHSWALYMLFVFMGQFFPYVDPQMDILENKYPYFWPF